MGESKTLIKPAVLVIDDEVEVGNFLEYYFRVERGYPVAVANSGREVRELLKEKIFDLALVDLKLPDTDGITLLKMIIEVNPVCVVIIMTGYSTVKTAVEAIKLGAFDYVDKPFKDLDELDEIIDRAVNQILNKKSITNEEIAYLSSRYGIITSEDSPFKDLLLLCKKVASKKISILIEGETGTGKEVIARYIHANSNRADYPFFGINCGALTETLLESELFGHEKGAFTGAQRLRRGIFELADKGTLFLDEIGEATLSIQVKLLRVLETGEFFRVGSEKENKTDVRIIAATNKSLHEAVKHKLFREDLLYRLDGVYINVPPLRERRMDILPLARHFIEKNLSSKDVPGNVEFSPEAMELLYNYNWPGNVRELFNVVARALALREGPVMGPECLPESVSSHRDNNLLGQTEIPSQRLIVTVNELSQRVRKLMQEDEIIDIKDAERLLKREVDGMIKEIAERVLEKTGNDRMEAARLLNVSARNLRYLLNEKK
jgi:two-component system NtrC family response regulator